MGERGVGCIGLDHPTFRGVETRYTRVSRLHYPRVSFWYPRVSFRYTRVSRLHYIRILAVHAAGKCRLFALLAFISDFRRHKRGIRPVKISAFN